MEATNLNVRQQRVLRLLQGKAVEGVVRNWSVRALANELGTSTRLIQDGLAELEVAGLVVIRAQVDSRGLAPNEYQLAAGVVG